MAILALEKDLYVVLLLATVNRIFKALEGKITNNTVQIGVDGFLERLNGFSRAFRKQYGYLHDDIIERSCLKALLSDSEMHKVMKIDGNVVVIHAIPDVYEQAVTKSVVEAGMRYSTFLTKNINDLATVYAHESRVEKDSQEVEKREAIDGEKMDLEAEGVPQASEENAKIPETTEGSDTEEKADTVKERDAADVSEVLETVAPEPETEQLEPLSEEKKEAVVEVKEPESRQTTAEIIENPESIQGPADEEAENEDDEDEDEEDDTEAPKSDNIKSDEDLTPEPLLKPDTPSSGHKRSLSPSASSYQQRKRFQHIGINLVNSIQAHRFSSPFLQAVNRKEALDYYDVIYNPKHLKGILKSIKLKQEPYEYNTIKELERDIMLMFANCIMYNRSDADLVELTKSMKDDVNNTFKMFEEAESEMK